MLNELPSCINCSARPAVSRDWRSRESRSTALFFCAGCRQGTCRCMCMVDGTIKHNTNNGWKAHWRLLVAALSRLCRFCGHRRCKCTREPVEDIVSVAGILMSRHIDRLTGLAARNTWEALCAEAHNRRESNLSFSSC